ncbi:MAG: SHOCT domain-containing protein [Chloracidobacterium sp.]|nr:SHOCT domain-containing protein [Chloracidobacterium sp.]
MSLIYSMKGVQDLLEVFEDRVTITPKGVLGFLNKGMKGTKEIPFHSIVAVQFKESGSVISGYIQFTIPGGNESKGGVRAATKDENTFMFAGKANNAIVIEIKNSIDSAVHKLRTPQSNQPAASLPDELLKLAKLKEDGILSDEEFQAAKKRLIG